jgi:hypothetical protein
MDDFSNYQSTFSKNGGLSGDVLSKKDLYTIQKKQSLIDSKNLGIDAANFIPESSIFRRSINKD